MNPDNNKYENRTGFTLIELLLVMAIISVLATLALVVVGDAQYDARRNATQARINQISSMLLQRMENYEVRRIPLDDLKSYVDFSNSNNPRQIALDLQRQIIADIINVEMPRSLLNVAFPRPTPGSADASYPSIQFSSWVDNNPDIVFGNTGNSVVTDLSTQLPAFATRFIQYLNGSQVDPLERPDLYPEGKNFDVSAVDPLASFQANFPEDAITANSEYLYLILETTQFNGLQGTTALGEKAFADNDGDGFPEVVDFWGNPIQFRFEMYDESNELLLDPVDGLPADLLDPMHPAIPIRNIRVHLWSTGNGPEIGPDGPETISN